MAPRYLEDLWAPTHYTSLRFCRFSAFGLRGIRQNNTTGE